MVSHENALAAAGKMKTSKSSSGKPYPIQYIDDRFAGIYDDIGNLYNIRGKSILSIEYYGKALKLF